MLVVCLVGGGVVVDAGGKGARVFVGGGGVSCYGLGKLFFSINK